MTAVSTRNLINHTSLLLSETHSHQGRLMKAVSQTFWLCNFSSTIVQRHVIGYNKHLCHTRLEGNSRNIFGSYFERRLSLPQEIYFRFQSHTNSKNLNCGLSLSHHSYLNLYSSVSASSYMGTSFVF